MVGQWFSPGTPLSSTNKTNCHDIAEILLKVALNTITPTLYMAENHAKKKNLKFMLYTAMGSV